MTFCHGDTQLVSLLVRTLTAYVETSSLEAIPEKTAIYFYNVNEQVQEMILQVSRYKKGTFPFKYLGVTIRAKRLTKAYCDILIENVFEENHVLELKTFVLCCENYSR